MDEEESPVQVKKSAALPSVADLLKSVKTTSKKQRQLEESFKKVTEAQSVESERKYTHLRGLRDHYRHKGWWSFFLMALMSVLVLFQCFLLWKVGAGSWDFKSYDWLLPALLVQNLAQIVGLATFVVRSLFKEQE